MIEKAVLGHINCPVCDFEEMHIKEDKNGKAFAFCPDCAAQVFSRNEHRDRKLREKMRPVTVTVPLQEKKPVTVPVPTLTPPVTVPKTPTPEKQKTASWLQPILRAK